MNMSDIGRLFVKPSTLRSLVNRPGFILNALPVVLFIVCTAGSAWSYEIENGSQIGHNLAEMSIEDLMDIEVSVVSKQPERYFDTPAAIFVISSEDIQRSGATSIPELLRMVPGADVERINSNQWAVNIRGPAYRLSRTLLVMVDGRSVYSPTFGGVFWEDLDLVFEDIDHIEVVRGPGGTYWGASATTGVVNIITKKAQDTQGGLLTMGAGTPVEKAFGSVRYGGVIGGDLYYRIYAKYTDRDGLNHKDPKLDDFDKWRMGQVGFRADKELSARDSWAVQGDFFNNKLGLYGPTSIVHNYFGGADGTTLISVDTGEVKEQKESFGGNILARWNRNLSENSDLKAQIYYDKSYHRDLIYTADSDILDLDFHHSLPQNWRQQITWGLGYRFISSKTKSIENVSFTPNNETYHLFSAFIQDDMELVRDRLHFIIGSKFGNNQADDYEVQPSARILWMPTSQQTFWAAVSRTVRSPSRIDYQFEATSKIIYHNFDGLGPDYLAYSIRGLYHNAKPEDYLSYELGHRIKFGNNFSIDTTAYYMSVHNSESVEWIENTPSQAIVSVGDKLSQKIYGGEIFLDYKPVPWWRLNFYYEMFHLQVSRDADSTDTENLGDLEKYNPSHQGVLRSYMDLPWNSKLDWMFRYVAEIPFSRKNVDDYYSLDVRLAWKVKPNIELSLVGQNLLDNEHAENSVNIEIPRGFYGKMQWQW